MQITFVKLLTKFIFSKILYHTTRVFYNFSVIFRKKLDKRIFS